MGTATTHRVQDDSYFRHVIDDMEEHAAPPVGRRGFLKLAGLASGGLVLAFTLGPMPARAQTNTALFAPNAYLRIGTDGKILIYSKAPEIGQGIKTAFPMIVAEELDADWADVHVEQAPINPAVYGRQSAGGSRSIPTGWDTLRRAGAVARAMLVRAAARRWSVPEAELTAAKSVVMHAASGRKATYGALAEEASEQPVPDARTIPLKNRKDFTLIGTRVPGVDNAKIVTGQPLYGIDQVVPDMLYATYTKCPAVGGRVTRANLDEIKAMKGVKDAFVLEGTGKVHEVMPGVAIVATSTWAAIKAKRALKIDWDERAASKDSWHAAQDRARALAERVPAQTLADTGNVATAFAGAPVVREAFYAYPYLPHAPLEPQNCTAHYRDGAIEIWAPTQTPDRALPQIAAMLGIPEGNVLIHQLRAGGGFGRRLSNDYMCEVAMISRKVGRPVKLQWTREDDMMHDFYRPGGFHALKGAVDANGKLIAWSDHFITFTGNGRTPVASGNYDPDIFPGPLVANYHIGQSLMTGLTPTGPWRAPRSNAIAFAVQSFLHELSTAAGRDHVAFLLDILGDPRWLKPGQPRALNTGRAAGVIKLAAQKAGWGRTLPKGRGLGMAFYFSHEGYFAEVADVSVDANRHVTVHKITMAGDIGPVVNMSGAETEAQGAIIDGLSTALGLQVDIEKGRIQQHNFDTYPVMRIATAPEVDVHFIQSDFPPTGLGEPALPPVAPALCNAIFAATGERVRTLPLSRSNYTAVASLNDHSI